MPDVEHDLRDPRHLVRVREAELLGQARPHRCRRRTAAGAASRRSPSAPDRWPARSRPPFLAHALGRRRLLGRRRRLLAGVCVCGLRHRYRTLGIGHARLDRDPLDRAVSVLAAGGSASARPTSGRSASPSTPGSARERSMIPALGVLGRPAVLLGQRPPRRPPRGRSWGTPAAPCRASPCRRRRSPGPCRPW